MQDALNWDSSCATAQGDEYNSPLIYRKDMQHIKPLLHDNDKRGRILIL